MSTPLPRFNVPYVKPDGTLMPQGEIFQQMARYIDALEARIETLETASADHEARITALEP